MSTISNAVAKRLLQSTREQEIRIARTRFIYSAEHNLAVRCRESHTEVIAMFGQKRKSSGASC
jgi:hypothetical protein